MSKRLYLDFTGYKRSPHGMDPFVGEIVFGFQSVREKGLNMVDASQMHTVTPLTTETMHASGD